MANCQYCGQKILATDRFCSCCGAPIPEDAFASETAAYSGAQTVWTQNVNTGQTESGDYSVILVSLGTCAKAAAADLLEDTIGYTQAQAQALLSSLPTEAAVNLSRAQAVYIAQAMTEYGMEASVQLNGQYVDLGEDASASVFDSNGNFVSSVLRALGVLTAANRLTSFKKRSGISWLQRLFRPKYRRPAPPPHQRRLFGMQPQPNRELPPASRRDFPNGGAAMPPHTGRQTAPPAGAQPSRPSREGFPRTNRDNFPEQPRRTSTQIPQHPGHTSSPERPGGSSSFGHPGHTSSSGHPGGHEGPGRGSNHRP